jgi:3-hydroxyisobutyrate dehydrogenase-like beta-hydroxyacid dehydrogenase
MNGLLARWPVFAGAALLALTGWAQAAATGTVKGSVGGPGGPVVGARVVIDSGSDSSYTAIATADQNGEFTFSDAPVGGIEVKVYDAQGNMLVSGRGNVRFQGDVITLVLRVP